MRIKVFLFALLLPGFRLGAEVKPDPPSDALQTILQRLAALEDQNRQLLEEVHALRQEIVASRPAPPPTPEAAVSAPQPPLDERVDVAERRIDEQSQTKVE